MSPQLNLLHFLSPTSRLPPDVSFLVLSSNTNPVSIMAHKCFLAEASPVFDKMFFLSGIAKEQQGLQVVNVENVTVETFRMFVEYFYGKEYDIDKMSLSNKYEMFLLVDKYNIVELKEKLLQTISSQNLTKETFLTTVKLRQMLGERCGHNEAKTALEMNISRYMKANLVSLDKFSTFISEHSWLEGKSLVYALSFIGEADVGSRMIKHYGDVVPTPSSLDRRDVVREFLIFSKFPVERVDEMVDIYMVAKEEGRLQM